MSENVGDLVVRVRVLEEALKPFAEAYKRIQYYREGGPDDLSDDARLYAEEDNSFHELFADGTEEGELLAVGHLANAAQLFDE